MSAPRGPSQTVVPSIRPALAAVGGSIHMISMIVPLSSSYTSPTLPLHRESWNSNKFFQGIHHGVSHEWKEMGKDAVFDVSLPQISEDFIQSLSIGPSMLCYVEHVDHSNGVN
jgi:hypothetical protein